MTDPAADPNHPDHVDGELTRLDNQIEALTVLVRHNEPFPGTEHEEPYRTYREQLALLVVQRNIASTDHFLGYLAEEAWPEDWFEQFASHAIATRAAGKNLRDGLAEAGWVEPGAHQAVVADRDLARERVAELNSFRDRVANLLDAATLNEDHLLRKLADLRNAAIEARNPGSVDQ